MTILRRVIGTMCIIIGMIGLLMPVLPGWVFIITGIYFVSPHTYYKGKEKIKSIFRLKRRTL